MGKRVESTPVLKLYHVWVLCPDEYPALIRAMCQEEAANIFMAERAYWPFRQITEAEFKQETGLEELPGVLHLYRENDIRKAHDRTFTLVGVSEVLPGHSVGGVSYGEENKFWFLEERNKP